MLVLLQGLLLNNVALFDVAVPYIYVLFVLMLPFETPNWLVLLLAFVLGLTVDVFISTLGMHISASVFMAFGRSYLLKLIQPRGGYEFGVNPSFSDMGISWYAIYAGILVLFHHLFLFYIESFKFSQFFSTFGRAFASTLFTMFVIVVFQLLIGKSQVKR